MPFQQHFPIPTRFTHNHNHTYTIPYALSPTPRVSVAHSLPARSSGTAALQRHPPPHCPAACPL
eukprot:13827459-Alexandrium_andersonii.AAC.1